ncbi:MAG: serine/threonine-protein kinase [Gemmatimonadota bacterium]
MEAQVAVQRAIATPTISGGGGSFERDLRALLLGRCRLVCSIGVTVTAIAWVLHTLVLHTQPELDSPFAAFDKAIWLIPPIAFLAGLIVLRSLREKTARTLQNLAFGIFAANIVVAMLATSFFTPAEPLFIATAVLLFVPAALIPWPLRYQVALGATAVASFLLGQALTFLFVPGLEAYWATRGGSMQMVNHVIEGTVGNVILAAVSVIASSTLYSLRKTAHKAKRLGNYFILGELGQGGMGQVFVAQHSLLCRPTAVKVMKPEKQNPTSIARFEREVRLSATLTHPNTITIFDFGHTQGNEFFYAMEYLEGLDLQELVERFGPVPPARTAFILAQVAGSLAEAHSRDIVHRDIKPSNVFLTRRGGLYDFVKVLDFGLAKEIQGDSDGAALTQTGTIFGTPLYIAPETVYGPDEIDGRADLYNLGGVAYWMLTGQPPFSSSKSMEVLIDHVKTQPKRPSEISELDIPVELEDIVMRLLEKKPEDRFESAEDLEDALQALAFEPTWNRKKAREWWSLHGIVGDNALDCECFAPEDQDSEETISALVFEPTA